MAERIFGKPVPGFYAMACVLWKMAEKPLMKTSYINNLQERFDKLYPYTNKKELIKQYICCKVSVVLLLLTVAAAMGILLWYQSLDDVQVVDSIQRNEYWGSQKEESLIVEVDGEKQQQVMVTVPERKYEGNKVQDVLEELAESLEKTILKENDSLDNVTTDLNLVTTVPDTDVDVIWTMQPAGYMMYDGTLVTEEVTHDGIVVNLTAALTYEDNHLVHSFAVCLNKGELTHEEELRQEIAKEIEACNVSQAAAKELQLPEQVGGKEIQFQYETESNTAGLVLAVVVCAVLSFFVRDEKIKKELEYRQKQMLLDYSEIVSKLTLLMGAGMTIRMALEKIAGDYNCKRGKGERQHYAYDEILYVCREMQGGLSERAAIDMLGNRCQIPCYMKLCTLLQQNLKKGSKGMAQSLTYEVGQAFEERKNVARRFGEEAGTRLLFPMILMLVIVLVVLIVPAFLSF